MRRTVMALLLSLALVCGMVMVPPKADAYYGRYYAPDCYVATFCDVSVRIPARSEGLLMSTDVYCDGYACYERNRWIEVYCDAQWWWQECDYVTSFWPIGGYVKYVEISYGATRINWVRGD